MEFRVAPTEIERTICRPDLCMKEDVALVLHVKWTIAALETPHFSLRRR